MASDGAVQELCKEASCSICLDYFTDPVTLPECGHNFCRDCLTRSWVASRARPSCPQCRRRAQKRKLRPNQQLANFVEIAKKFSPLEGKEAEAEGRDCEKHQEPLKFLRKEEEVPLCVICSLTDDHEVVLQEEALQESRAVVGARKERACLKHQEPLKLFCKVDEALICLVCDRSKEHRDHETLPLEEASQEYKDKFCNSLEVLRKEKENILARKGDVEKESQDMLNQTTGGKQEMVAKFRQLHQLLEEQERLLLAQMEEVEEEVVRERDHHLAELSEALSTLEGLIQEVEAKCQQSASELLQNVQSTLQRYEEKKAFENPMTFPLALKWRLWDVCDINLFLESFVKQTKDILDSGLHLQKAKVALDPDTAYPSLIVSEDQKSVRVGQYQALPTSPERFDLYGVVLAGEGFRGGRHFWEVLLGSEGDWAVGVARRSVMRKGRVTFSPEAGFWEVGKWGDTYRASVKGNDPPLTLSGELKRMRVFLNFMGGQVAFFNADTAALLYKYSGASFSGETLLPFFWLDKNGHLKIST